MSDSSYWRSFDVGLECNETLNTGPEDQLQLLVVRTTPVHALSLMCERFSPVPSRAFGILSWTSRLALADTIEVFDSLVPEAEAADRYATLQSIDWDSDQTPVPMDSNVIWPGKKPLTEALERSELSLDGVNAFHLGAPSLFYTWARSRSGIDHINVDIERVPEALVEATITEEAGLLLATHRGALEAALTQFRRTPFGQPLTGEFHQAEDPDADF